MSANLAETLTAATPRLTTLELAGALVLDELVHPSVRTLRITGHEALGSLRGAGEPLSITELALEFRIHDHYDSRPLDLDGLLPAAHFPSLARLDLTRNDAVEALALLRTLHLSLYLRVPGCDPNELLDATAHLTTLQEVVVA